MRRVFALALAIVATLTPLIGSAQTDDDSQVGLFANDDVSQIFMITRVELGATTAETAVREDFYLDAAFEVVEELGEIGDELKGKDVPAIKGASPIRAWEITIKDKPNEFWVFAADGWFYFAVIYEYDEKEAIKWLEGAIASGERTLPTDPPKGLDSAA